MPPAPRLLSIIVGSATVLIALGGLMRPAPAADVAPGTQLLGATVVSEDHELVGAVDAVVPETGAPPQTVVIGLGGFLGVGEKDVAVPAAALTLLPSSRAAITAALGDGRYAGSTPVRVMVAQTLQQLLAAPAYRAPAGAAGEPSGNSGTPSDVHEKEPPSSTSSGGPG